MRKKKRTGVGFFLGGRGNGGRRKRLSNWTEHLSIQLYSIRMYTYICVYKHAVASIRGLNSSIDLILCLSRVHSIAMA